MQHNQCISQCVFSRPCGTHDRGGGVQIEIFPVPRLTPPLDDNFPHSTTRLGEKPKPKPTNFQFSTNDNLPLFPLSTVNPIKKNFFLRWWAPLIWWAPLCSSTCCTCLNPALPMMLSHVLYPRSYMVNPFPPTLLTSSPMTLSHGPLPSLV